MGNNILLFALRSEQYIVLVIGSYDLFNAPDQSSSQEFGIRDESILYRGIHLGIFSNKCRWELSNRFDGESYTLPVEWSKAFIDNNSHISWSNVSLDRNRQDNVYAIVGNVWRKNSSHKNEMPFYNCNNITLLPYQYDWLLSFSFCSVSTSSETSDYSILPDGKRDLILQVSTSIRDNKDLQKNQQLVNAVKSLHEDLVPNEEEESAPIEYLRDTEIGDGFAILYLDEVILCVNCRYNFMFISTDRSFYALKGFRKPTRCKNCREVKKQNIQVEKDRVGLEEKRNKGGDALINEVEAGGSNRVTGNETRCRSYVENRRLEN